MEAAREPRRSPAQPISPPLPLTTLSWGPILQVPRPRLGELEGVAPGCSGPNLLLLGWGSTPIGRFRRGRGQVIGEVGQALRPGLPSLPITWPCPFWNRPMGVLPPPQE